MKDRGHNRDPKQCRVKLKELRQAYQKTREANGRSGSEPKTCRFYDELHAILGGSATTTPAVLFVSFNGDGGNMEAGFGDEEDDDEVVDSSQQGSGETGFPDSQELFLTLDPVPPNPPKAASWTHQAEKGPLVISEKTYLPKLFERHVSDLKDLLNQCFGISLVADETTDAEGCNIPNILAVP
ncbi:hypothetical protein UY3_08049 [Chelonia mydas]|uniref:Myb/SANT-like DNA-binding domain-containing protein n=1 Tax=Chelonia mydas TaxID=8469 RepID=M7BRT8_CHEMY|nr:hypothetical protein UY3_08049 [Chelonia mydas]